MGLRKKLDALAKEKIVTLLEAGQRVLSTTYTGQLFQLVMEMEISLRQSGCLFLITFTTSIRNMGHYLPIA